MSADSRSILAALRYPPFIASAVVLIAASVCTGPVADWLRIALRKDPVYLQRPLSELSKQAVTGYAFRHANTIEPAILNSLGTEMYIDWEFTDETGECQDPALKVVRIMVTYYTGKPDLVPHTPDVCYLGSGYQMDQAGNMQFELRDTDGAPMTVPVRAVSFIRSSVYFGNKPTVVYTFHCNGRFVNTRTDVRKRMANPFHKGAYYCKIELSFGPLHATHRRSAGREATIQAAERFLGRFLPVLEHDHLPDWETVQQGLATDD